MPRFRPLPHWVLTDSFPAFYDTESATAIEQTARLYAAMQKLIDDYNLFVDQVNEEIKKFECGTHKDMGRFKKRITDMFYQFRRYIENYMQGQDSYIKTAVEDFETRFSELEAQIFNDALFPETIAANIRYIYDSSDESLDVEFLVGDKVTDNLNWQYDAESEFLDCLFEKTVTTEEETEGDNNNGD